MTSQSPATNPAAGSAKSMDAIMALCKRRGFVYQASEIYGGINGFWDYGPLGSQLKKNLRDAWWQDMVLRPCWGKTGPGGKEVRCVPVETCIIQHPKVWAASGHVGGFNDPMMDCKESKRRYRADHLRYVKTTDPSEGRMFAFVEGDADTFEEALKRLGKYVKRTLGEGDLEIITDANPDGQFLARVVGPHAKEAGTLTEPRAFNLMFKTYVGATATDDDVAYLRPETAQGVFVQFKNVVDTTRVKVPFGIGNVGKSFRNEVTPRNFTFRSREFEQMELEFFCHPDESMEWFTFWREFRMAWWESLGLAGENLRLYDTPKKDLAHYSQAGSDVEYRFPFTYPGFGELEGVAHRGNFDLTQHQQHSGAKMEYNDTERGELLPNGQRRGERYLPHCIEPAAGLDRGVLAVLCEAYTKDESRPSPEFMKIHPRLAPIKAAVFPLVAKDGMPEIAHKLHDELLRRFWREGLVESDDKQTIGKRYARMDEAGCPYCFTIDSDTLKDQTVTVRDRDTGGQQRIAISHAAAFLSDKLGL
ncbi:MAG: glycine--tRNA ligase [Phycisphaerales bacterium]|nr:glycine--tRNA ligase [Phycisphaerales bacterium]